MFKIREDIQAEIDDDEYIIKTEKYLDENCIHCDRTGLWVNIKTEEVVCSHCERNQDD